MLLIRIDHVMHACRANISSREQAIIKMSFSYRIENAANQAHKLGTKKKENRKKPKDESFNAPGLLTLFFLVRCESS